MRVVVAVAILCCLAGRAHADEGDAFYAAVALERAGHPAEAAAAHEALAARAPTDPFADDALIEAGRIYEEKLGQPRHAAEVYERLVRAYPDSRQSVRARRRAELIREALGADNRGEAALAAWNDILNNFPQRTREQSIQLGRELMRAHPDWSGTPRVHNWLGEQAVQLGQHEQALAIFAEVAEKYPGSEAARRARRSQADELVTLGRYDEAERVYASMRGAEPGVPYAKELDEAVARLDAARLHARLEVAAWVALAVLLVAALAMLRRDAGSASAAARALVRPPLEAIYLMPVAVLLTLAGQTQNESVALAMPWMAGAMIAIAWLGGAGLVAARAAVGRVSLARVALSGGAGAAAMLAAAYVIVRRTELLDFLIHTVRFGVD